VNNSFRWSQINLDLVFGRDLLIGEMLEALPSANGDSFGITGARRMGKTTVLRCVERDLCAGLEIWRESGTSLLPVYIDGLALPRPLSAEFLWGCIYQKICRLLHVDTGVSSANLAFPDFVEQCTSVLDKQELVPKVIVIFDEIEHIIINDWAAAYFANWRALLSNYPGFSGYFSAVFSGALEMAAIQHDVGSPLMDVLQWRSLRSLNFEEVRRLITEPTNLTISDELVLHVFLETGGHPMMVQYVMQKAINDLQGDIANSINMALSDFEESRAWQFSEWWSKYCDVTSRLVYAALPSDREFKNVAEFAIELGGYAASRAFEVLQHVGIAELSEDKKQIRRRGNMFSRWQKQNGNMEQGAAHDSGLANLLLEIGQGMREKYISAWAIYGQNMPNYSGAVSEMRDLITLTLHKVAPDEDVVSLPGFKFEADQSKPTRRQRVMFLFGIERREQGKAVASEDELLEMHSTQLAGIVAKAYANASSLTHTTATRPLAYQALKQGESILAQLISRHIERTKQADI